MGGEKERDRETDREVFKWKKIYFLIKDYVDPADRVHGEIWIQGVRNTNGVWSFHDDSVFPTFMNDYMDETHKELEKYLRYMITGEKFFDDKEDRLPHNFVCEHRFIVNQMSTMYP